MNAEPLLTVTELAQRFKGEGAPPVSRTYIYAMIYAGLKPRVGNLYTVSDARQFLKDHPDFVSTDYCRLKKKKRKVSRLMAEEHPTQQTALSS